MFAGGGAKIIVTPLFNSLISTPPGHTQIPDSEWSLTGCLGRWSSGKPEPS